METRTLRMGSTAVAQMTGCTEGEISFYGHDILGSVTARCSDRGQRVEELEYRAFGEVRWARLTTYHPYCYTGKAMDRAVGIDDYGLGVRAFSWTGFMPEPASVGSTSPGTEMAFR